MQVDEPHEDEAFRRFATEQARPLLRAALVLCGDWHLAEDLTQEALARMFLTWRNSPSIVNPEAYAHVVLVRTYLQQRRRRSFHERPAEFIPDEADRAADPALSVTLARALAELSPGDRAVLVLRYLCDRSVNDVAEDLQRSPTAIRSMSLRALERVRARLGHDALEDLRS